MEMEDSAASDASIATNGRILASESRTEEEDAQQMTSPKTKKARTESMIPTPTRNSIAKVAAQHDNVYFDYIAVGSSDEEDDIVYYKEIEDLEVNVDVEDFHSLISVTTEGPQWVVAQDTATSDTKHVVKKADFFRSWMSTVLPPHFAPVFDQPRHHALKYNLSRRTIVLTTLVRREPPRSEGRGRTLRIGYRHFHYKGITNASS
jgi:hypothetical protein